MPYRNRFLFLNQYITMCGDPIFVMDQISDEKNQDENWLQGISIKEAMQKLNSREKES